MENRRPARGPRTRPPPSMPVPPTDMFTAGGPRPLSIRKDSPYPSLFAASDPQIVCTICTDKHPQSETGLIFGCHVCHACIRAFFERAIASEDHYPPKWGRFLLNSDIYGPQIVPPELVKAYRDKEVEYLTPVDMRIYCSADVVKVPRADGSFAIKRTIDHIPRGQRGVEFILCGTFMGAIKTPSAINTTQASEQDTKAQCHSCKSIYCLTCAEPHTGPFHNCTGIPAAVAKTQAAFEGLTQGKDYQICPSSSCRRRVQLIDGCNHIDCRCGQSFCFHCGEAVEAHGNHWVAGSCPRYNHQTSRNAMWDDDLSDDEKDGEVLGTDEEVLRTIGIEIGRNPLGRRGAVDGRNGIDHRARVVREPLGLDFGIDPATIRPIRSAPEWLFGQWPLGEVDAEQTRAGAPSTEDQMRPRRVTPPVGNVAPRRDTARRTMRQGEFLTVTRDSNPEWFQMPAQPARRNDDNGERTWQSHFARAEERLRCGRASSPPPTQHQTEPLQLQAPSAALAVQPSTLSEATWQDDLNDMRTRAESYQAMEDIRMGRRADALLRTSLQYQASVFSPNVRRSSPGTPAQNPFLTTNPTTAPAESGYRHVTVTRNPFIPTNSNTPTSAATFTTLQQLRDLQSRPNLRNQPNRYQDQLLQRLRDVTLDFAPTVTARGTVIAEADVQAQLHAVLVEADLTRFMIPAGAVIEERLQGFRDMGLLEAAQVLERAWQGAVREARGLEEL